jgi:AcrR family transcriptional regulator
MNPNTRTEILNVALELFSRDGFNNTSTDSIIKEAKVSKGLLFYHFKSKENILDELLNRFNKNLTDIIKLDNQDFHGNDRLMLMIERYFNSLKNNYESWRLYVKLLLQESFKEKTCSLNSVFFEKYISLMESIFKENYGDNFKEKLYHFELLRKGIFYAYISQPDENQLYLMKNFLIKQFSI